MFSGTDAACVAIAIPLCLKKGKESLLGQEVVQTKATIRTRKSPDRLDVE
jgi:hypothetical protein